jgi:hypothetical protein
MRVGDVEEAHVEVAGESFAIRAGARWLEPGDPGWEPVRSLDADGISLLLDDVDLYRDCYRSPVRDRLSETEADTWQAVFADTWKLLTRDHPEQAAAMRVGLRVITPLAGEEGGGSSARHAYGALALTGPADPETLAMVMVREFGRAQFGAVLDMYDLAGGDARAADGRSEAYGGLAVAGFRHRRDAHRALGRARAILDRRDISGLPEVGRRFVSGMRAAAVARLDDLEPCQVAPDVQNRDDAARTHRDM